MTGETNRPAVDADDAPYTANSFAGETDESVAASSRGPHEGSPGGPADEPAADDARSLADSVAAWTPPWARSAQPPTPDTADHSGRVVEPSGSADHDGTREIDEHDETDDAPTASTSIAGSVSSADDTPRVAPESVAPEAVPAEVYTAVAGMSQPVEQTDVPAEDRRGGAMDAEPDERRNVDLSGGDEVPETILPPDQETVGTTADEPDPGEPTPTGDVAPTGDATPTGTAPSAPSDAEEEPPALPELEDPTALRGAVEAILMVVEQPVSEVVLAQVLDRPTQLVATALGELVDEYRSQRRGFQLRQAAGGWRFYTSDEFAPYVERFVLDGQQVRLTQAALETLAVVAYKQPVTRGRVSAIRGVNCDGVIRTLLSRGLIEECGQEPDSGAHLYRTTILFLERMGINSVDELPELAPFLPDDLPEEV